MKIRPVVAIVVLAMLALSIVNIRSVQNQRVIPPTSMADRVLTGMTHGAFVWTDRQGGLHKAKITQAEYDALPLKPPSAGLTDAAWADILARPGFWKAAGGRETLNTPSGEPVRGTARRSPSGVITIYTGDDLDIGIAPKIHIPSGEYTGTYPSITTNRSQCGTNIVKGVWEGNLDEACARNSRRADARN